MRPIALALFLVSTAASAEDIPMPPTQRPYFSDLKGFEPVAVSATHFGYFNGIGSPGRSWEIRNDTTFGTKRVFSERFEVARAWSITNIIKLVMRVSFGMTDDTQGSLYLVQGPLPSIGFRFLTERANFFFEGGVRALIPYPGPKDADPGALVLAQKATLSSGIADDASWLPLSEFALQGYLMVMTRICVVTAGDGPCPLLLGVQYGASISRAAITSWLGPQHGFIGNTYFEVFGTLPHLDRFGGLQIGLHADVSLSAIWPGTQPFPTDVNLFVGWSPVQWFSTRVFLGAAAPVKSLFGKETDVPYGVRFLFYIP